MNNIDRQMIWKKYKSYYNKSTAQQQSNRLTLLANINCKVEYDPSDKLYWIMKLDKVINNPINNQLDTYSPFKKGGKTL